MTKNTFERDREPGSGKYLTDKDIGPTAKNVAIAISWHLNRAKGYAWPGIATLAGFAWL